MISRLKQCNRALVCCALLPLALVACASNPKLSPLPPGAPPAQAPIDTTALPRLLLPNAEAAEVRALAMGAARLRGWSILPTDATTTNPDRLVVTRPADPAILAQVMPQTALPANSNLEITTFFTEAPAGLEVAMRAEVVIPPSAQGGLPTRIDYTDTLSDTLMQSLEALRERWIRDRDRLARAVPPAEGWKSAWDDSAEPVATEIERPQAIRPTVAGPTSPPPVSVPAATHPASIQAPRAPAVAASLPRNPQIAATPRPLPTAGTTTGSAAKPVQPPAKSPDKPRAAAPRPAPAIDASQPARPAAAGQPKPASAAAPLASTTRPPAAQVTTQSGSRPASGSTQVTKTATPAASVNRGAPAPTGGTRPGTPPAASANRPVQTQLAPAAARPGATAATSNQTPPAKAEQYAKQRGCRAGRAQLIEARRDGEVYRVPCQGSDSLLVHCRSGICRGLL